MADTEKIEILLRARDRDFAKAMDRNNKLIARFEREASKATTASARNIDRDMQSMGRSVDGFSAKINGAIGGLLGTVAAGALSAVVVGFRGVISGLAQVGDEARRAGVSVQAFQELSYVATATRIPIDALVDGLKELSLRGDEFAVTGAGSAAEAFARLGYSAAQVKAALAQPDQMMLQIIGRMEKLDKAAQIRVADEIFGGTGGERFVELMAQGESGMRQMIAEAHTLGAVLDREAIEKAQELDRKFQDLTVRVESFFKRAAVAAAEFLSTATEDFAEGIEASANVRLQIADEQAQADLRARAARLLGEPGAVAALGDEAAYLRNMLDQMAHLDEERLIAAEAIASAYRQISAEAQNIVPQLERAADSAAYYAETVGDEAMAEQLRQSAEGIRQLVEGFTAGTVTVEDFNRRLAVLTGEADAARMALETIDGIDFDSVKSGLGHLRTILSGLYTAAVNAASAMRAMPSPETMTARRTSHEGRLGNIGLAPVAVSPGRPEARPNDIDFGVVTPEPTKGGGGKKPQTPYADSIKDMRAEIAQLEQEAAILLALAASNDTVGDALAYARTQAELLAKAQEEGREITPTLREEIAGLARDLDTAATAADEAAQRLADMQAAGERGALALADVFMGVLDGSKSAKQAVGELLMQMAKIQIQQAFIGALGGTGFGQAIGMSLSGARAAGGPVTAGGAYLVNEETPNSEVFVPSRSGAVLNVPQAQSALRQAASQGGGGRTLVEVIASPLLEARIREIASHEAGARAHEVMASIPAQVRKSQAAPRRGGI